MRVQFFAFCSRVEEIHGEGYNLYGVGGTIEIQGRWRGGLTPPPLPFESNLVVGFVEGEGRRHRVKLVVHPPGHVPPIITPESAFDWPQDARTLVIWLE